ncbi:hypothetical protein KJ910_02005 [Patescibacteria group bacterium]|nr:hypothetical protein [Patescibacteria group bacterium]MBU1906656.1 hypothetical protein [Patescibacteria group bacterium]
MVHEPRQHYDPDEERYAFRQLIFARPDGQVQVIFKGRFDPIRFFWSEGERHLAALVEEKYEEDFEIKSRWLFVSSSDTAELEVSEERADKIVEVALSPEGEIVAYREDNGKRSVLRDTLHRQLLAGDNISGLRYGRTGDRQFIRYNVGSGRRAYSTLVFMKNQ